MPPDQPARPPLPTPLADRERAALRALQQLVRDRAAAENAFAEAYRAASEDADREVQKARKTIAAARKREAEQAAADHETALAGIDDRYDAAQRAADKRRFDLRKRTVDQYSAGLEKARSELADKVWTLDSIHEANEKQAQDRFADLSRKAESARKRGDVAAGRVLPVFARLKVAPESLTFPEDQLPPPPAGDPVQNATKAAADVEAAAGKVVEAPLQKLTGTKGLGILVAAGVAVGAGLGFGLMKMPASAVVTGAGAVLGLIAWVVGGVLAKAQVRNRGIAFGVRQAHLARASRLLSEHADSTFAADKAENARKHAAARKAADEKYLPRIHTFETQLKITLEKIDAEHEKATEANTTGRAADTAAENDRYARHTADTTARLDADLAAAEGRYASKSAAATAARDAAFQKTADAWFAGLNAATAEFDRLAAFAAARYPAWPQVLSAGFRFPDDAPVGVRFGERKVDLYALPDGMPFDHRLNPAEPIERTVPAYLPFPEKCSVVLKARGDGRPAAVAALQAMMLRFLTGLPAGKVRFTIIDPVGLGENFAAFMHLADFDEKLVTARIWTEPAQIEQRLTDLTEHMENVIQKYLRNQYKSIEEYNLAAGEVAEPYRVLVIANFPHNFTADAARRLISVASSGPACGVCTLLSVDTAAQLPRDFSLADLEQVSFNLSWDAGTWKPADAAVAPFPLAVDGPPDPQAIAAVVRKAGEASKTAARVEVPFEYIAPPPDKVWTGTAAKGVDVPIGRAGATRRQHFILGRGTAQHALIAGKTGSGKSTLLHALITNLALTYSPEEVELYLIDFKKGVEFQAYAANRLPHARVIAIESEREFGLSVLQRLDGILRERGEAFRAAGVNDLAGFRAARPDQPTPRILFVVDEFQEFFVEDDKLAQEAGLLLDRLVRQGRAFGVHVLLGSQTLGGAYSLARSTIDQMAVRIALQCSEADAQLILSKDNSAARLLNRPGEAIYNDANGLVEGNDPFQVVWLSDDRKERYLADLRNRAERDGRAYPPALVFEGSEAADVRKNKPLARLIGAAPDAVPAGPPVLFLGDPIAIKDPTAAVFRPQSAANLLMLGQHEEGALGLMTAALVSLAAKLRPAANGNGTGRVVTVLDPTPDDSEFSDFLRFTANAVGLTNAVVDRPDLPAAVADLAAELARRQNGETADRSPRFLLVHGLQRLRELRKPDDDYSFGRRGGEKQTSPGEHFAHLLRDGPPLGVHCVVWCDSLTNLQRALDRGALKEFVARVLFQMSPSDSSNLLDSPAASRLGKNRALFAEEGSERPEKFRPYGLPDKDWLRQVGEQIVAVPAG